MTEPHSNESLTTQQQDLLKRIQTRVAALETEAKRSENGLLTQIISLTENPWDDGLTVLFAEGGEEYGQFTVPKNGSPTAAQLRAGQMIRFSGLVRDGAKDKPNLRHYNIGDGQVLKTRIPKQNINLNVLPPSHKIKVTGFPTETLEDLDLIEGQLENIALIIVAHAKSPSKQDWIDGVFSAYGADDNGTITKIMQFNSKLRGDQSHRVGQILVLPSVILKDQGQNKPQHWVNFVESAPVFGEEFASLFIGPEFVDAIKVNAAKNPIVPSITGDLCEALCIRRPAADFQDEAYRTDANQTLVVLASLGCTKATWNMLDRPGRAVSLTNKLCERLDCDFTTTSVVRDGKVLYVCSSKAHHLQSAEQKGKVQLDTNLLCFDGSGQRANLRVQLDRECIAVTGVPLQTFGSLRAVEQAMLLAENCPSRGFDIDKLFLVSIGQFTSKKAFMGGMIGTRLVDAVRVTNENLLEIVNTTYAGIDLPQPIAERVATLRAASSVAPDQTGQNQQVGLLGAQRVPTISPRQIQHQNSMEKGNSVATAPLDDSSATFIQPPSQQPTTSRRGKRRRSTTQPQEDSTVARPVKRVRK